MYQGFVTALVLRHKWCLFKNGDHPLSNFMQYLMLIETLGLQSWSTNLWKTYSMTTISPHYMTIPPRDNIWFYDNNHFFPPRPKIQNVFSDIRLLTFSGINHLCIKSSSTIPALSWIIWWIHLLGHYELFLLNRLLQWLGWWPISVYQVTTRCRWDSTR